MIAGTVMLSGCASDSSSVEAPTQSEQGSDMGPSEWEQEDGFDCEPSERFCLDRYTSAFCDESGAGHGLPQTCESDEVCSEVSGYCGLTACEPGSWTCAGSTSRRVCHESGTDWVEEKTPCPNDGLCLQGECVGCVPGTTRCHDGASVETCAPDGFGYMPATECDFGQGCPQDVGSCVDTLCVPGTVQCTNQQAFTECNPNGDAWTTIAPCPAGTLCIDGGCEACPSGQSYCLDESTQMTCDASEPLGYVSHTCGPYQICLPEVGHCEWGDSPCVSGAPDCIDAMTFDQCLEDGSSWAGVPENCSDGEVCNFGACVSEDCQANIMFLVDRSGSMQGEKWGAVLESIGEVIHGNRSFRYGVRFFPPTDGPIEKGPPGPHLALGVLNSYSILLNLFTDWYPEGNTPLTTMLDRIVQHTGNFFEGNPGALILLTDGEPGCWPSAAICDANLISATESLWYDSGIRTYPIGFAFGGDTSFLDTIAQHGGTGLESHLAAEDAAALTEALEAIVHELDECDDE